MHKNDSTSRNCIVCSERTDQFNRHEHFLIHFYVYYMNIISILIEQNLSLFLHLIYL